MLNLSVPSQRVSLLRRIHRQVDGAENAPRRALHERLQPWTGRLRRQLRVDEDDREDGQPAQRVYEIKSSGIRDHVFQLILARRVVTMINMHFTS
jgi:hypothetical protein